MGCFCRHLVIPPIPERDEELAEAPSTPPVIEAVSHALSSRWLPPAIPWEPDPDWLQAELPTVPMSPATLAVVIRLIYTRKAIMLALKLDPLLPAHQTQLARIVATLNRRTPSLAPLAEDWRPWAALARLNDQVDVVQKALAAKLFEQEQVEAEPLAPWRPLLAKLKPLLPVVAVVNMLELDTRDDPVTALKSLTLTLRRLRKVVLPPLARPQVIMQLIARNEAVARLESSIGALPFEVLRDKVVQKLEAVQEQLPPGVLIGSTGQLEGMPPLEPNPSLIINAPTVAAAIRLNPVFVTGLNWNVSVDIDAPLLKVGEPVVALIKGNRLARAQVRSSPCDGNCDAAAALATALQDSGIGAAPAA